MLPSLFPIVLEAFVKTLASKTNAASIAKIALLVGLLLATATFVLEASTRSSKPPTTNRVEGVALQWFAQMRTGQIDRTQLTPEFSKQLSDNSVRQMAQYLKNHDYGVAPLRSEVVQQRKIGEQTFYVVELVFPRGDATSLLFGFNLQGKITGISLLSMAGD
jgi:hypothetical protein